MKTAAIFRQLGDLPPMDYIGKGCFAWGYGPDLLDPKEFKSDPNYDVAFVSGNLRRYNGINQRIFDFYRGLGKPVFVIETGRLADYRRVRGTWFFYMNRVPFLPSCDCPPDRREMLGMNVEFKPRGEAVLVIGQDECFDRDLDRLIVPQLRLATRREIRYRPRKGQGEWITKADTTSTANTLEQDLDDAWCVVTHSSNVGGEALMRGIPAICDYCATYAHLGTRDIKGIDSLEPPPPAAVEDYLNRLAYICYTTEELSTGNGFKWLMENYGGGL